MRVGATHYRSIFVTPGRHSVSALDQTRLPRELVVRELATLEDAARAIETMVVRGAPLIGVTAAYGVWLGLREDASDAGLGAAFERLLRTRPTAVNLRWALERARAALTPLAPSGRAEAALAFADGLAEQDVAACEAIGRHGAALLRDHHARIGAPPVLQVLTHCNAGWLATVDWGTALAPLYRLHDEGLALHVWVDETRPRNQGYLTAWELTQHGIPNTVIVDNAGGLLLQRGQVHACIVGSDRTTRRGDVCNKIGTYLKALAARAHGVPFFVALPESTFDLRLRHGADIPIEHRDKRELFDLPFAAENPAFDVTPAELVSALITERGVVAPNEHAIVGALTRSS